jgi:hypothetical protein
MAVLWLVGAIALGGCSSLLKDLLLPDVEIVDGGAADAGLGETGQLPGSSFDTETLMVTGVDPGYGSFLGGNTAVVRGNGFAAGTSVSFGANPVSLDQITLVDSHRLKVIVPSGEPGQVDISVKRGAEEAVLPQGYTYNALAIKPERGSVAGGLLVAIVGKGTHFGSGATVTFGEAACAEVTVTSETEISCRIPAMAPGVVDVAIVPTEASEPIVGRQAFTYENPSTTSGQGLAGGPISGSINITVIDNLMGVQLPGAFVMLGDDLNTQYKGLTNARGQITFSGPGLKGPITVHAALKCFEKGSIVALDAGDVTVILRSQIGVDPECKITPDDPSSKEFRIKQAASGGHGRAAAYIAGEVTLPAQGEFSSNDWNRIPAPREGEVRAIYVFTSSGSSAEVGSTSAGMSDRIEEGTAVVGKSGYPYKIISRPAALAVYALAGVENSLTREFAPYLMGIVRNLVPQPDQDLVDVDIEINIPLDKQLSLVFRDLPKPTSRGPDWFSVRSILDLGGEGYIHRQINGFSYDKIERSGDGDLFAFYAQPPLAGPLADARYKILAGWYTGNNGDPPYTSMVVRGIAQTDSPTIVDGWLGIPDAISPGRGLAIPKDRRLRWHSDGAPPDLQVVVIVGGDGLPAWRQIVPGSVFETSIPDLSSVEGLRDIGSGSVTWAIKAVKIPNFDYNAFQYTVLTQQYWTHEAYNTFTARR